MKATRPLRQEDGSQRKKWERRAATGWSHRRTSALQLSCCVLSKETVAYGAQIGATILLLTAMVCNSAGIWVSWVLLWEWWQAGVGRLGLCKAWSVVYVSAILLYVCKKERLQWHQLMNAEARSVLGLCKAIPVVAEVPQAWNNMWQCRNNTNWIQLMSFGTWTL